MRRLFLLVFLIACFSSYGQIIEGRLYTKSSYIEIYEPLGIGVNSSSFSVRIKVDSSRHFRYKSSKIKQGFFKVIGSNFSGLFFLIPSDTLIITIDSLGRIDFKDKKYYNRLALFAKSSELSKSIIRNIYRINSFKFSKICDSLLVVNKNLVLKNIDSLHNNNLLNDYFYSKLSKELKAGLYWGYISKINSIIETPNTHFPNLIKLKNELYADLNPTDTSCYFLAQGWSVYLSLYLEDIKQEVINQNNDTSWTIFSPINRYSLFSKEIQEYGFGNGIISSFRTNSQPLGKVNKQFIYFSNKFPNSEFIPVIRNYFNQINYKLDDLNLHSDTIKYISVKKYNSLQELIRMNFNGNSVFIDIWASWCGPCKEEFKNNNWLIKELGKRGISLLYLSLDVRTNQKLWLDNIAKYGLKGKHYRTDSDDNLGQDLERKIFEKGVINIPRYVLMNGNGNIIGSNLPRPSTGQKLLDEIDRLIKEDKKNQ